MRFALVARRASPTNLEIVSSFPAGVQAALLTPEQALLDLAPGDVALGRLDVLATVDGVEDGMAELGALSAVGVHVLNPPEALLAAHDKLLTARTLALAGVAHPVSELCDASGPTLLEPPVVVKPRFGSWGYDVLLCEDGPALAAALGELATRPWFAAQGVLVQELVPPRGFDLRVVVAGGRVVGAVERVAAPGEWRTNVSLGGTRLAVASVPAAAAELAVSATAALGLELAGVDLLPAGGGRWVVLEVNGAADFTADYSLGEDVFGAAAAALVERMPAQPGFEEPGFEEPDALEAV